MQEKNEKMTDIEKIDELTDGIRKFYAIYCIDNISQTSNVLDLALKELYDLSNKIYDSA